MLDHVGGHDVTRTTLQDSLPQCHLKCVQSLHYCVKHVNSPPLRCIVYVLLLFVTCGGRLTAELENCCPFREEVYLLLQQVVRRMLAEKKQQRYVAQRMIYCEIFGF